MTITHPDISPQVSRDSIEYRTISGWAVAGLLLGALSASAIVGPVLWCVPVLGMVVSFVGMRKITASQGQLSGWNVAFLGLLLAIFFGAAGPARTMTRRVWLNTRAKEVSRQLIELLEQHQPYLAHQLTRVPSVRRPLPPDQPEPYVRDTESKKDYDAFLRLEPVQTLLTLPQPAKIELLASGFIGSDDVRDIVGVQYRITPSPESGVQPFDVQVFSERTLAYGSQTEQWRILPPALKKLE